jgi:hypothetical protein
VWFTASILDPPDDSDKLGGLISRKSVVFGKAPKACTSTSTCRASVLNFNAWRYLMVFNDDSRSTGKWKRTFQQSASRLSLHFIGTADHKVVGIRIQNA